MSQEKDIEQLKKDLQILQTRVGGAEFVIKQLVQKLHPNEISALENEMKNTINNYGSNSAVTKVMEEGLRLIGK